MDHDRPLRLPADLAKPADFKTNPPPLPYGVPHPSALPKDAVATDENEADIPEPPPAPLSASEDEPDAEEVLGSSRAILQEDLERETAVRVDLDHLQKAQERDVKLLEKTKTLRDKCNYQVGLVRNKRDNSKTTAAEGVRLDEQIEALLSDHIKAKTDVVDITERMTDRAGKIAELQEGKKDVDRTQQLEGESLREFLIRTGNITPFSHKAPPGTNGAVENALNDRNRVSLNTVKRPGFAEEAEYEESETPPRKAAKNSNKTAVPNRVAKKPKKSAVLSDEESAAIIRSSRETTADEEGVSSSERKGKRRASLSGEDTPASKRQKTASSDDNSDFTSRKPNSKGKLIAESESSCDSCTTAEDDSDFVPDSEPKTVAKGKTRTEIVIEDSEDSDDGWYVGEDVASKGRAKRTAAPKEKRLDDGDEKSYQARLKDWCARRRKARRDARRKENALADNSGDDAPEWHKPHPTKESTTLASGEDGAESPHLHIPGDIYGSLFDYQKTGVQWLWELHNRNAGGLIADEPGLGKTIQIIAFIAGLHHTGLLDKPCLIVAPATLMKNWVEEFHTWWPALRVSILHSSGSGMLKSSGDTSSATSGKKLSQSAAEKVVNTVFKKGHVLVTTYEGLNTYADIIRKRNWQYAILDECHKLKNPDTEVTITCKRIRTRHRIGLTGTPIQNNLRELWSLLDFCYPLLVGDLPTFTTQFSDTIRQGSLKTASNAQVVFAQQRAAALKEAISPYLLRRLKTDVARDLPPRTELVIGCLLTKTQHEMYKKYLQSAEVKEILAGSIDLFRGLDILKKICNHPSLIDATRDSSLHLKDPDINLDGIIYSGKMLVMRSLLRKWKAEGHRCLLFSQTKQSLNLLERYLSAEGFTYRRMDGDLAIGKRQSLVDAFNNNPSIDLFLLTTRVGGLGLNLIGADRVILFDPDWNPSTDAQARERAWRIGQRRPVEIVRLIAAGTVEETIYQRQLYKEHLAKKILQDAKTGRSLEASDAWDLFQFKESRLKKSRARTADGDHEYAALAGFGGVEEFDPVAAADEDSGAEEKRFVDDFLFNDAPSSVRADRDGIATLAASRALAKKTQIGTLTYTGTTGAAGLLANLRARNGTAVAERKVYIRTNDLAEWFEKRGCAATNRQVMEYAVRIGVDFESSKPSDQVSELRLKFRKTLKNVASVDKDHTWRLKKEWTREGREEKKYLYPKKA